MTSYDSATFFHFFMLCFCFAGFALAVACTACGCSGGPRRPMVQRQNGQKSFRPRLLGAASGERNQHETCENQHDDMIHNSSCFFANSSVLQELCKPVALA